MHVNTPHPHSPHTHSRHTFQRQRPQILQLGRPPSHLLGHEYSSVDLSIKELNTLMIQPITEQPTGNRIFNTQTLKGGI